MSCERVHAQEQQMSQPYSAENVLREKLIISKKNVLAAGQFYRDFV